MKKMAPVRGVPGRLSDDDYESREKRRMKAARAKAPQLCARCIAGKHDGERTAVGCLEVVAAPPDDYVCGCVVCVTAGPRADAVAYRSSQRVVMGCSL